MRTRDWYLLLSARQRVILFVTLAAGALIIALGLLVIERPQRNASIQYSADMSIRQIASQLEVSNRALAVELNLPIDVSKRRPLRQLGVTDEEISHTVGHFSSHADSGMKYYLFIVLVLSGYVYLTMLGRPDGAGIKQRGVWYPRFPYMAALVLSVLAAGFLLGKSPNPMEGVVKVFKSMVGLYPDPAAKVAAFLFFLVLAVVGNKLVCGWACPFGALQELIYSIPVFRGIKKRKLPFALSNTIRGALFMLTLLVLFGFIGGRKGFVLYHNLNPFNLFDLNFENAIILMTVTIALAGSVFVYRPFCQLVCPFGFVSWIFERFSLARVRIEKDACIQCGACIRACPLDAAKGLVEGRKLPADCFSCGRCLNVCPTDALRYESILKRRIANRTA